MSNSFESNAVDEGSLVIDRLSLISGLSKEDAHAFIDSAMAAQSSDSESSTRAWRITRNTLSPFNSLPDEVIVEVFWLLVLKARIKSRGRSRGWIVVTHICHRWRAVAIAAPQLWSSIDWFYDAWAETCLERCKTVPLRITCSKPNIKEVKEERGRSILTQHLQRTRDVSLKVSIGIMTRVLECFSLPAPALEILDLGSVSPFGSILESTSKDLLEGHAPVLRVLRLNHINLNVPTSICSNLRHLSLSNQHSHRIHPSFKAFISILRHSPRLVTLKLKNGGPYLNFERSPKQVYETVELPHLQLVSIRGFETATSAILAHISAPTCNYADVTIYSDLKFHDLYSVLPHDGVFWKSWVDSSVAAPIHTMHFNGHFDGGADLHCTFPPFPGSTSPARKLRIRLELPTSDPIDARPLAANAFSHFSHLFHLKQLSTFHVSGCGLQSSWLSKDMWEDVLRYMPALTRLELSRTSTVELLLALQANVPGEPGSVLCPSLRTLRLKDVDYLKHTWEECIKFRASKDAKMAVFVYEKGKICGEGDLKDVSSIDWPL